MGGIIDRLGTKMGYTISKVIWSIFGMLYAAIRPAFSLAGFITARFGPGIGGSGNFPAAIKSVAEWFPKKDRTFAIAGSSYLIIPGFVHLLVPKMTPLDDNLNYIHYK
jgi:MFS family permease